MVIYRRMLKTVPNSAEAQARYAGMLYRMHGLPRAERHLLSALRVGKVPGAPLLATTARLQYIAGQREKALETVIELEGRFPDSPDATVMAAWRWLETGHAVRAIQVLQEHAWVEESASAQRVLIDAYTRLGQPTRTRTALETAMALLPEPDLLMRRQYARALYDTGDFRRSLRLFQQLSRSVRLRSDERVRIAGALYETGAHGIGRRILTDLVDERPPSALAVAELATREGHSAAQAERVRSALEALLEKNIRNRRALRTLAGFEIANGTPERAIEPLERAIAFLAQHERRTGIVDLILARVQLASGDIEAARATALRALDTEPTLAEALPLAASLYRNAEEARAAIQEMRKDIDDKDQPAQRHALLGRLYIKAGQVVMARWSYEQALTKGLRLPILHNDLAYLLAKRGRDLQRARLLAQQAFEAMPGVPGAADTLGFVLLKLGAIDEAVREFRRALELARLGEGPTAEIQYHLGLALAELGRSVDAEKAFETALALDADFGDADDARRQLARVRGES
jgi:tetratricopeptide (TPR) repeat protein